MLETHKYFIRKSNRHLRNNPTESFLVICSSALGAQGNDFLCFLFYPVCSLKWISSNTFDFSWYGKYRKEGREVKTQTCIE